jgi:glycosyltransferase involved in cell wall biosynthesis
VRDRLRLLLVSQPLDAGVPRHVLDVVDGLDPARFAVSVATPRASAVWAGLAGREDVALHALETRREPGRADLRAVARLVPLVRRADVVHAHSSKAGFLARLAAALAGRRSRCVFTPHAWSFWAAGGREAALYLRLERLAAHWCRAIVAVSDAERAAGVAAGVGRPEQYRVIPNGVDLARFAATPSPVPGRVLMLGRLARQKRPELALCALARVRQRVPEAHLLLAGGGPLRPEVERLVGELGLGDAVQFLGDRRDVPELLREASCLLLASDWEACPYSVLEAMAAGVPVVATAVGGVPELVRNGETGLLAAAGDEAALARALEAVLGNAERASALGAAGRADAGARFAKARMVGELAALYESLV